MFSTGSVNDSELATGRHIEEGRFTEHLNRSTLMASAAIGGEGKGNSFRFDVAVYVS